MFENEVSCFSQSRMKLNVVKWSENKWNWLIQCEIMQKKSMKGLELPTSVFLQGDIDGVLELFAKNKEHKENKNVYY